MKTLRRVNILIFIIIAIAAVKPLLNAYMTGKVLSVLFHLIAKITFRNGNLLYSILQIRKLRHRGVK